MAQKINVKRKMEERAEKSCSLHLFSVLFIFRILAGKIFATKMKAEPHAAVLGTQVRVEFFAVQ